MTIDEVLAAARKVGFQDEAALRRLARPAAVLRPGGKAEPGSIRGSKIGGLPSLPGPGAWPKHGGRSLSFLAQVDLADVPPAIAADLPREGLLSFFYVADQQCWGFDTADKGKFAVLHLPDARAAKPAAAFPEDLPEEVHFGEFPVGLEETVTLPPWDSVLVAGLGLDKKGVDTYAALVESFSAEEPGDYLTSRLLGHPDQVQGDMSLECAVIGSGVATGDGKWAKDPRLGQWEKDALDWRLLFQLHSFGSAGMCWGDLGALYFWMRRGDLAKRDFGAAWMILQCS